MDPRSCTTNFNRSKGANTVLEMAPASAPAVVSRNDLATEMRDEGDGDVDDEVDDEDGEVMGFFSSLWNQSRYRASGDHMR